MDVGNDKEEPIDEETERIESIRVGEEDISERLGESHRQGEIGNQSIPGRSSMEPSS